jgi:hypothetical protein
VNVTTPHTSDLLDYASNVDPMDVRIQSFDMQLERNEAVIRTTPLC